MHVWMPDILSSAFSIIGSCFARNSSSYRSIGLLILRRYGTVLLYLFQEKMDDRFILLQNTFPNLAATYPYTLFHYMSTLP